ATAPASASCASARPTATPALRPPAPAPSSCAPARIGTSSRSSRAASTAPRCPNSPPKNPSPRPTRTSAALATTTDRKDISMMNQQTMEKLKEMRLNGLAAAWLEQQSRPDYAGLGFDERLGLLVDSEWMSRQNARLKRNLKEARLKLGSACLEDLDYDDRRELDKPLIRQLATCNWVVQHQNIAITGPTGTGTASLACACAERALRRRYRAIYRRTSRLFEELALARADGTYARLLAKLARVDVLILDDWAMTPLGPAERR